MREKTYQKSPLGQGITALLAAIEDTHHQYKAQANTSNPDVLEEARGIFKVVNGLLSKFDNGNVPWLANIGPIF